MKYHTKKTDQNQKDIVRDLRKIPGITVDLDHDDILVGYRGKTYWFEIKNPERITKAGRPWKDKGQTQQKQGELEENWKGHYQIVWKIEQILEQLNIETIEGEI